MHKLILLGCLFINALAVASETAEVDLCARMVGASPAIKNVEELVKTYASSSLYVYFLAPPELGNQLRHVLYTI